MRGKLAVIQKLASGLTSNPQLRALLKKITSTKTSAGNANSRMPNQMSPLKSTGVGLSGGMNKNGAYVRGNRPSANVAQIEQSVLLRKESGTGPEIRGNAQTTVLNGVLNNVVGDLGTLGEEVEIVGLGSVLGGVVSPDGNDTSGTAGDKTKKSKCTIFKVRVVLKLWLCLTYHWRDY